MLHVPATKLAKPLALGAVMSASIYTFIMPQLSSYYGLGLLLFSGMFILRYFFTGFAQKLGTVAFVNVIPIQNQQTYDFAMEANTVLYMGMILFFLFMLSYLVGTPRPEKKVLAMVSRFFRSTEFLMSSVTRESNGKASVLGQWKLRFYLHEMKSPTTKVAANTR